MPQIANGHASDTYISRSSLGNAATMGRMKEANAVSRLPVDMSNAIASETFDCISASGYKELVISIGRPWEEFSLGPMAWLCSYTLEFTGERRLEQATAPGASSFGALSNAMYFVSLYVKELQKSFQITRSGLEHLGLPSGETF